MKVKKKLVAVVLSGTMLTMALSGCGSSQTSEETAQEGTVEAVAETGEEQEIKLESGKVELTVGADADQIELMEKMCESFKQKYEGQAEFEITLMELGSSQAKNIILGDVHNAPDVFSMADDQLYSLIAAGAISPVVEASTISSENVAEAVAAATYKETLYAYPYTADNGYFLYYDKKYLSESDVQTLDGILAVAESAGKEFSMDFSSGWYMYSFFGGTGLEMGLNEDGVTNHCNWNATEGAIKGVDIAEALLQVTSNPAFIEQSDGSFIEGVQSGRVIAGISGVWNAVTVREAWGSDYGACKLPTYTCAGQQIQMSSFTGYKMMGVNSYSEHEAWAHKLAQWLTNEENQTIRFEERSQGPSNIKAAASDVVSKEPAIAAIIDQSQYGKLQRVGNHYWDACVEFGDIIAAGNPDGKPLQDMMDTLVAGITASAVE